MTTSRNISLTVLLSVILLALICKAQSAESKDAQSRFDELMQVIRTGNTYQRAETIPGLAHIDDPRVVPALIALLKDDNDRVRAYAAQQLDRLADTRSTKALAEALKDSSSNVRIYAADGLAKIGDQTHVPVLVKAVMANLPKPGERYQGKDSLKAKLQAISKLSPKAPPKIVGLLKPVSTGEQIDKELWWLYEVVARCLSEIGDRAGYDKLEGADQVLSTRHSDYKTWHAVRKAMAIINPEDTPFDSPAADILNSFRTFKITKEGIYLKWVLPLAELGSEAIDDIEWALRFRETRRQDRGRKMVAIQALGEIGGPQAAKVLRGYIDSLFVDHEPKQQALSSESKRPTANKRLCRHL